MKRLHKLSPRVTPLHDFYVFDTETGIRNKDGSIQWHLNARPESFIFGVIYGYNYTKIIYELQDFKETLLEPRFKKKKIFAHNLFYDGTVLYGNIFTVDPNAIFNGKLICFTNGNCTFADSSNIFGKIKLAKIGKMLGIIKPDLGDENLFSKNGITKVEINRCITDCQIVYDGLIQMFNKAGDIKITVASLSMTYYRRFHQPYNIDYNEHTNHFFSSYFGGRTEAFKIGYTHSSVIDVNSMYPYVMKTTKYPNPRNLKISDNNELSYFLNQILPHYEGCIYCTVETSTDIQKHPYGYLPYKHEGKLLFPTGRFKGCWNFNEIRFALESGGVSIKSIEKIVYSERMPSPFVSFVDGLYSDKLKEQHAFMILVIKNYLTNLYGKFAQRIDDETIYIDDVEKHIDTIRDYQRKGLFKKLVMFNATRNDAFLVLKSTKNFVIPHSIPSFASYITSGARVHLLKQMIALHSKKVVYCDTDSVFFEDAVGIENETGLGGWKVEKKIITAIWGLKNYEYIDEKGLRKHRIKGVPEKAIEIRPNYFEYENLLNTKEALRRNLLPGVLIKRTKNVSGKYDKRIVLEDGTTKPITII